MPEGATARVNRQAREYWEISPPGPWFVRVPPSAPSFFDEIDRDRFHKIPEILEEIEFGIHPGARVLEVGCGSGADSERFALLGANLVALDVTQTAIRLSRDRFSRRGLRARILRADSLALPFEDECFDQVYSHGVLHHVFPMREAIREAHRVLRKGGLAKIALYNRDSLYLFYHVLYKNGVQRGGFANMSMSQIASYYSESRRGCPLTQYTRKEDVSELFRDFSEVTCKIASQVRVNRVLGDEEIEELPDAEMKEYFLRARRWEEEGTLEEFAGRFLYIRAVK